MSPITHVYKGVSVTINVSEDKPGEWSWWFSIVSLNRQMTMPDWSLSSSELALEEAKRQAEFVIDGK
ncbi:hypothetical protein WK75_27670 [Burkholderia ubonensis]|uniref:hypothetical protein n=1 Tax=Burkholderia ubonensis TaxID=101571 RepID=UPI00075A1A0F|nr:hypothetical protein [Burkholderia ubonensis]KVU85118.1 hypothetical protein WK75_27670 [Burkholderia ubonensis]